MLNSESKKKLLYNLKRSNYEKQLNSRQLKSFDLLFLKMKWFLKRKFRSINIAVTYTNNDILELKV